MLIIVNYLFNHKKMTGKVLTAASSTPRLGKMAKQFGLDFEVVKVGFKYIASIMLKEDVLLGGEESGGIAIKGHIPERDGIWMGLVIWEYMAKSGKSLEDLIDEVYKIVGPFKYQRDDLHITEELKVAIMKYLPISSELFIKNRLKLSKQMVSNSIAIFNSNDVFSTGADSTLPFEQHRK